MNVDLNNTKFTTGRLFSAIATTTKTKVGTTKTFVKMLFSSNGKLKSDGFGIKVNDGNNILVDIEHKEHTPKLKAATAAIKKGSAYEKRKGKKSNSSIQSASLR